MQLLRTLAASLLSLLVLELGLHAIGYHPPDLRRHSSLFPSYFPAFYEPDRDLGWKLKPNLKWPGTELGSPFSTDVGGHRTTSQGRDALPMAPVVDCVGDSSTFGYGVGDDETYPALLGARLAQTGVLDDVRAVRNLGVPGYTAFEARLLAQKRARHAPVTLVLLGFNDHFQTTRTRATALRMRRIAYRCFTSRLCSLLFHWMPPPERRRVAKRYVPDVSPDEYRAYLTETVRTLREAGSQPILLVYPSLFVRDEAEIATIAGIFNQKPKVVAANVAEHPRYQELTRAVAAREQTPLVDLASIFDAAGNESHHGDWVHPNRAGYALITRALEVPVAAALASARRAR